MNPIRYWLLTRTGAFHDKGLTYEIRPEFATSFWRQQQHWLLCWLAWHPHLMTIDEDSTLWFVRRWVFKSDCFSIYIHHYPTLRRKPEAFGWHAHPLNAVTLILRGGYIHGVKRGRRNNLNVVMRASAVHGIFGGDPLPRVWVSPGGITHPVWKRPAWFLSSDDTHRVLHMNRTWSIFVMWGRSKGWFFEDGETLGSSRQLAQGVNLAGGGE